MLTTLFETKPLFEINAICNHTRRYLKPVSPLFETPTEIGFK
jgi:hypothetical protein